MFSGEIALKNNNYYIDSASVSSVPVSACVPETGNNFKKFIYGKSL